MWQGKEGDSACLKDPKARSARLRQMSVYPSFNTSNERMCNMPTGTVKFFDTTRGFGFITPDDGSKDIYVHTSAVKEAHLNILMEGQRVEYEVVSKPDGRTVARNLKLVD